MLIQKLIKAFTALPGIGNKSATRFTYFILEHHREKGLKLAKILQEAIENVGHCQYCRSLSETEVCKICVNPQRDSSKLCIVENPTSIISIEDSGAYNGKYFVLGGYLSPIDGISAENIGVNELDMLIKTSNIEEVILATSASVEAEVTNHYLENILSGYSIKITKIARGIPLGGELEYTDINTIAKALIDRG